MTVQRNISSIFEYIFLHFDSFPKSPAARVQLKSQIRMQKMLTYIYEHYAQPVTLADIAGAANISRSEAGRCFQAYMGCSPVDASSATDCRPPAACWGENTQTLQQISQACGFNSVNYFSRKFRQTYGCAPGRSGKLGK